MYNVCSNVRTQNLDRTMFKIQHFWRTKKILNFFAVAVNIYDSIKAFRYVKVCVWLVDDVRIESNLCKILFLGLIKNRAVVGFFCGHLKTRRECTCKIQTNRLPYPHHPTWWTFFTMSLQWRTTILIESTIFTFTLLALSIE